MVKHISCRSTNVWGRLSCCVHHLFVLLQNLMAAITILALGPGIRGVGDVLFLQQGTKMENDPWRTFRSLPSPLIFPFSLQKIKQFVFISPMTSGRGSQPPQVVGGTRWPHPLGRNQEEICCKQQQSAWFLCFNGFRNGCYNMLTTLQGDHYANAYSKQVGNEI